MSISVNESEGIVTLSLDSSFIFNEHGMFRNTYKERKPGTRYVLDFKNVKHIDSAALGMLLLFREHNGDDDSNRIKLINCNGQIRKIFEIANLHRLFTVG